jgi:acyl-CoA reductase-like NAD-dependent aldehyde dehydrogenase
MALGALAAEDPLRHEELFAPVLVVDTVGSDDEAIERANASRYGLAAAVHTRDLERGMDVARRLEAGVVGLNRRTDAVGLEPPFGGRKQSGNGVPEGGRYVYAGLTEHQAVYGSQPQ